MAVSAVAMSNALDVAGELMLMCVWVWCDVRRVDGEMGERSEIISTSGRTYYLFYVLVLWTDHPPASSPPRKICYTHLGCYDVRELGGKRTRIFWRRRCQHESNSHPTTLIKSFSVFYLIKMASSKLFLGLPSLICSLLRERVGCLHYFVLNFILARCISVWLRMMDCSFFDTSLHVWMPMANEKGRFNQQLTSCTLQVGKKRCIALPLASTCLVHISFGFVK